MGSDGLRKRDVVRGLAASWQFLDLSGTKWGPQMSSGRGRVPAVSAGNARAFVEQYEECQVRHHAHEVLIGEVDGDFRAHCRDSQVGLGPMVPRHLQPMSRGRGRSHPGSGVLATRFTSRTSAQHGDQRDAQPPSRQSSGPHDLRDLFGGNEVLPRPRNPSPTDRFRQREALEVCKGPLVPTVGSVLLSLPCGPMLAMLGLPGALGSLRTSDPFGRALCMRRRIP